MLKPSDTPNGSALRIAVVYAVVAALWIFLTDWLLSFFAKGHLLTVLSIVKGWGFVLVTGILLYVLVKRDLAHIYRAEVQWRLLFDSVNDSIYLFRLRDNGLPGSFLDVNEAAIERLGYTRDEFLSMSPWELTKPELHGETRGVLERLRSEGQVTFETVHVTRNGEEIPVEISTRAVTIDDARAVVAIARDITQRKRAEEERRQSELAVERDKRQFYRETLLAVTGGKFELGEPEEAEEWIRNAEIVVQVAGAEQLAQARHSALDYCRRQGLSDERLREFELAVGEALGNAIKHAGAGWLYAGKKGNHVWVAVRDRGAGIDTFAIPKVALMPGYTTKPSMGLGYTMILEVCDRVRLATGPNGTTVVMEKELTETPEFQRRISVHGGIE